MFTPLAWLQDTLEEAVWDRWDAIYRDVKILDSQNRLVGTYNLTANDLGQSRNRATLKQMFLDAAKVVDSDHDQLPDDWELKYFGNLAANPNEDSDEDGMDNFTEFAFGTNPKDATSHLALAPRLVAKGSERFLSVTFRRQAGALMDYVIEMSPDLQSWTAVTTEIVSKQTPPRNLFDGTGTLEAIYSLAKPASARPLGFIKVKAVPRVRP